MKPKPKTEEQIRRDKLYTHSQYHLTWRDHPAQDENQDVFEREADLIAYINQQLLKYPDAAFEVFYGHKVRLKPKKQIMSYEVER